MTRCVLLGFLFLVGCAGRSVPTVSAKDLRYARFPAFVPAEIALSVEEGRAPPPAHSAEIVTRVTRAVSERLAQDGLRVNAQAAHALALRLLPVEAPSPGFRPEHCVLVRADLRTARGAHLWGEGSACYAYKHAFGFSWGMPSRTYSEALNFVLGKLAGALNEMPEALRVAP